MEDESAEEQELKQAYFDEMHRSAEGDVPALMDAEYTYNRYRSLRHSSKALSSDSVIIANGLLKGKWQEKGSSDQSGRIMFAVMDTANDVIYALSAGGVVFSGKEDGSNWRALNDRLRIASPQALLLQYRSTGMRIIASGNKDCYYSDDLGQNWLKSTGLESVYSWGSIRRMMQSADDSLTVYALVQNWNYDDWYNQINVYKSTDGGASFNNIHSQQVAVSVNNYAIWCSPFTETDLYFQGGDTTYAWSNAQQSFQPRGTLPVPLGNRVSLAGSTSSNGLVMYAYADQVAYRSTDSAQTWTTGQNLGYNPFRPAAVYAPNNETQTLFVGGVNLGVSYDGGSQFANINEWYEYYPDPVNKLHADIPSVSSWIDDMGDEHLFICTDGGLYLSHDNGQTVTNISMDGLNVSQYYTIYTNRLDSNYLYAGSQDQGFQRSNVENDSIRSFQQLISGDYAHIVSSDSGQSIWYEYPGFIVYAENPTQSWSTGDANFDGRNAFWMPPLCEHATDKRKCYMAGKDLITEEPVIYLVSYDGSAVNYSVLNSDFQAMGSDHISAIAVSPFDDQTIYALSKDGKNFISTDGGSSFTQGGLVNGPAAHYFYGASIYPSVVDSGVIYYAGSGYSNPGVWKSTDNGATVVPMVDSLPETLVYKIVGGQGDSVLYAATEVGPFVYIASEGRWFDLAVESAPQQVYWTVEYLHDQEIARFGTYGRGIWDFDMSEEEPSDTTDNSIADLSDTPNLNVWPNPATDRLYIEKSSGELTKYEVFDLNGRIMLSGSSNGSIDIRSLPHGIYVLMAENAGQRRYSKFIKTR